MTERYPAWICAPQSDRKPLVTLRKTTEGAISRSEILLVTDRPDGGHHVRAHALEDIGNGALGDNQPNNSAAIRYTRSKPI